MDNEMISRREFGTVTAGASIGVLAPTLVRRHLSGAVPRLTIRAA